VILMDVQMPEMSGLDATVKIREKEQRTDAHIPIIGVTAQVLSGDREACLLAGMDDYVPKPVKKEILFEALARIGGLGGKTENGIVKTQSLTDGILDTEALALLKGLETPGGFSMAGLIDIYLESTFEYFPAIRHAIQQGDAEEVAKNAHAFKGSCHSVGVVRLAEICQQLEEVGQEGRLDKASEIFDRVRAEFEIAREALGRYLQDQTQVVSVLEEQVFDPTSLEDLRSLEALGDFSVQDTVDLFFEDMSERLLAARKALVAQDSPVWGREGHTIKSSARDLGAMRLAQLCQVVEDLGTDDNSDCAADLLDEMELALEVFKAALDDYLAKSQ
jgi:HPt (histidine-containing phosphotransfer) domain-containing protein